MNSEWTAPKLAHFKRQGGARALTMVTAYDATQARWCEKASTDMILVGDSLGMVVQGASDTLSVTMEDMMYHTRWVRRGAPQSFIVADMPFGSYQASLTEGAKNAMRLIKCGAHAVKLEGAGVWLQLIKRLTESGVPVMGHVGLTPQSIHQLGGFRVQGKTEESAARIIKDAVALEEAGCFGIVLESMPSELAEIITRRLTIPTIGIGAGRETDGQVLVLHDLLGFSDDFLPKFVKRYARLEAVIVKAIRSYCDEVNSGVFPDESHTYQ